VRESRPSDVAHIVQTQGGDMKRTISSFLLIVGLGAAIALPDAHAGNGQQSGKTASAGRATAAAKLRQKLRLRRPFKQGLSALPTTHIVNIGGNPLVAEAEYSDLRNSVKDLLKKFPAEQSFFVGLGRDPTPIIAFLQNLGGAELAANFPGASGKGWPAAETIPAERWTVFKQYFQTYIPAEVWSGTRDIVLMDQTNSGATRSGTLGQFAPYFDRYAREIGFKGQIRRVAFSAQAQAPGIEQVNTQLYPETSRFLSYPYEGVVSEYDRHTVGNQFFNLNKRGEYTQFKDALGQRMERDVDLDTFLAKETTARRLQFRPAPPPKPWKPKLKISFRAGNLASTPLLTVRNPGFLKAQEKAKKKAERAEKRRAKGKEVEEAEADGDGEGESENEPETYDYLESKEYDQLRTATLDLMGKHPPKKHFYVGVGRTSTAMVAFLENLGNDIGTYLPADGIHKLAKKIQPSQLDATTRQTFYELFDRFLPERVVDGGRDVVLFQQSDTGTSLPFLQAVMQDYLVTQGSAAKVQVVALSKGAPATGVPHIETGRTAELVELNGDKSKAISPYGYNRPGRAEDPADDVLDENRKPRPRAKAYGGFTKALGARMASDSALEAKEKSLFGGE
jgi:hypothetical protein